MNLKRNPDYIQKLKWQKYSSNIKAVPKLCTTIFHSVIYNLFQISKIEFFFHSSQMTVYKCSILNRISKYILAG